MPFSLIMLLGSLFTVVCSLPSRASETRARIWDTAPDTWVATDALGRSLATHDETGPIRKDRFVGIFYFLWLGEHGTDGPYDITKILAQDPNAMSDPSNRLWGPIGVPHHWGEPLFGYYLSDDEWVLRKHAQMLVDAGVDTLIFDVTNQFTYRDVYMTLCRVYSRIRAEGGRTPQIAFLTPFWDPARVVEALYRDLYRPGLYRDLWFRWEGKPLILADPAMIGGREIHEQQNHPARLEPGTTLGQTFTVDRQMDAVGGRFPTYTTTGAAVTLSLYRDGPGGERLARRRHADVADNAWLFLEFEPPLPAGTYYLEASDPSGSVGWWSHDADPYPAGRAYAEGQPVAGDRTLTIRAADDGKRELLRFFTFRKPNPDYFRGPSGPDEWAWLEIYPQHEYHSSKGVIEQMPVGVAQNAVDGRLGVLSNPRSHGRSFHDGSQPPPGQQDHLGRNFSEQARRALDIDPSFVFITGWNEWIAGRFPGDAPFHGAGPVSFVDQFNHEYSRDMEPVKGGHGDVYYYQLIDFVRRFKGTRRPAPAGPPKHIAIDGSFNDWRGVIPEFRDDRGDTAHRSHRGWGREGRYRNETGRNDFEALQVARDDEFVYFHVRTAESISPAEPPFWMTLLLDTDCSRSTGWEGYDFIVNREPSGEGKAVVERNRGGWSWEKAAEIEMRVKGNELELAIPRSVPGLSDPLRFDWKWIDHLRNPGDILSVYTDGDAAPNGRFNYRYDARPSETGG